ncbi:DoxX family protein [Paractinoplanes rhizophilus]|uniref:DoxX family protein n=1 Tax=Paractinoplanes rhizophilus TaxID=1416877 RepID=A0ABW2I5B8_9ACTN|nr:DoxX family protein [Actinoplanes sp.]
MDTGLLLLRLLIGGLLAAHGAQKLFGWFSGHGLTGTADFLESLGWRPGRTFAILLGGAEVAGGVALAMGAATPVAAGVVIAVLANAAWVVHRPNGLWNTAGGYEYPLVLAGAALVLALSGPGRFSIDHLAGWQLPSLAAAGVAIGVGMIGWLAGNTARDAGSISLFDRWIRPST